MEYFTSIDQNIRISLLGFIGANLRIYDSNFRHVIFDDFSDILQVPTGNKEGLKDALLSEDFDFGLEMEESFYITFVETCKQSESKISPSIFYVFLFSSIVIKRGYDTRLAHVLYKIRVMLNVSDEFFQSFLSFFVYFLAHLSDQLLSQDSQNPSSSSDSSNKNKYWKYAKIGAVALGTGTLLALTG